MPWHEGMQAWEARTSSDHRGLKGEAERDSSLEQVALGFQNFQPSTSQPSIPVLNIHRFSNQIPPRVVSSFFLPFINHPIEKKNILFRNSIAPLATPLAPQTRSVTRAVDHEHVDARSN